MSLLASDLCLIGCATFLWYTKPDLLLIGKSKDGIPLMTLLVQGWLRYP